jgi:diguanylate cyclase (GGDEF)-like protein
MAEFRDELAQRRAKVDHPSARDSAEPVVELPPADDEAIDLDSSVPEVLDQRALDRDAAAAARDEAALRRDATMLDLRNHEELTAARLLIARDRAAAAHDRHEAALDRHRAAAYLRRTYRDQLTGVLQREAGRDQLSREIDRAHREEEPLVIAYLDVVGMKDVNDSQGHAVGDELLRSVGSTLLAGLRSYDVVVRYGGDEFVCALPRARLIDAENRFAKVRRLLHQSNPQARVSIGLAELREDEGLDDIVVRADHDMYDQRKAERVIGDHRRGDPKS